MCGKTHENVSEIDTGYKIINRMNSETNRRNNFSKNRILFLLFFFFNTIPDTILFYLLYDFSFVTLYFDVLLMPMLWAIFLFSSIFSINLQRRVRLETVIIISTSLFFSIALLYNKIINNKSYKVRIIKCYFRRINGLKGEICYG